MINWDRIKELRDEVGADDFDEVLELFFEEVEDVMSKLAPECATADLQKDLHFLKGSALNLGFDQVSAMCLQGEQAAKSGPVHRSIIDAIKRDYSSTKATFLSDYTALVT